MKSIYFYFFSCCFLVQCLEECWHDNVVQALEKKITKKERKKKEKKKEEKKKKKKEKNTTEKERKKKKIKIKRRRKRRRRRRTRTRTRTRSYFASRLIFHCFKPFNRCLSVILYLDKGNYSENLQIVCLCHNK